TEERAALKKSIRAYIKSEVSKGLGAAERAKMAAMMARIPKIHEGEAGKEVMPPIVPLPPDPAATPPTVPVPSIPPIASTPKSKFHFTTGVPGEEKSPFGLWLEKQVKEKIGEDGARAKLFLETLRSNIPAMMLCCIPLFAFILKVLYIRKGRFYVEHLV